MNNNNNNISALKSHHVSDEQGSTLQTINDFYHVKYDHNMNDPKQFNLFYEHLSKGNSFLVCNIINCQAANIYCTRRGISDENKHHMHNTDFVTLACRIHMYFIHSYDISSSQLTDHEIKYIEEQLNEHKHTDPDIIEDKKLELLSYVMQKKKQKSLMHKPSPNKKFFTTEQQCINCKYLSDILKANKIIVTENDLNIAFNHYAYDEEQLVSDVSNALILENENITFYEILTNEFNCHDKNQRKIIYGIICHEYVMLNSKKFAHILQLTALNLIPNVNWKQLMEAAITANLTAKMFIKDSDEFKTCVQFAKIFDSMKGINRKQLGQIYRTMHKWHASPNATLIILSSSVTHQLTDDTNDSEEQKCIIEEVEYMEQGTDSDIVQKFCAITACTETVAVEFLKKKEWNVIVAINTYYTLNGDVAILNSNFNQHEQNHEEMVYTHGIAFWYWSKNKFGKRFVNRRYSNLKDEILQFKRFTPNNWTHLVDNCNLLIQTDRIKQISCNGNGIDIYGLQKGSAITINHLCSIKLYTDITWLCKRFCEAFRLKKVSENEYERLQSVQRRNEKVANWAKLLIELVQCYGTFMTGKSRYYRGVAKEFIFKKFITRFNVPLSTTTDFTKAVEFSGGKSGMVMELKRYNEYLTGFDCSIVSSYDQEKEVLFFGTDSIFQIKSVYQWYSGSWCSYRKYINQIQRFIDIANGCIKWKNTNNMKDILGYLLPDLYIDNKLLPPYVQLLLNYHLKHLPPVIEYDFIELQNSYQWVQDIFVKNNNIPNVANACNLFQTCNHIRILMGTHSINRDHSDSLVEDCVNLINKETSIEFCWEPNQKLSEAKLALQNCVNKAVNLQVPASIHEYHNRNSITINIVRYIKQLPMHKHPSNQTEIDEILDEAWKDVYTDHRSVLEFVPFNETGEVIIEEIWNMEIEDQWIVFGFIRQFESLIFTNWIIPKTIPYLCLAFYASGNRLNRDILHYYEIGKTLYYGKYSLTVECVKRIQTIDSIQYESFEMTKNRLLYDESDISSDQMVQSACRDKNETAQDGVFVLKKLTKQSMNKDDIISVRKEVKFLKQIRKLQTRNVPGSQYINSLVDLFEDQEYSYIVTEYCNRGNLWKSYIKEARSDNFQKNIMKQLLEGVQFLHKNNILHLSLHPLNILLHEENNNMCVKIIKFFDSRYMDDKDKTIKLSDFMDLNFISPEITKGYFDVKSDIWSIGVISFVMKFGFGPFLPSRDYESDNDSDHAQYEHDKRKHTLFSNIQQGFSHVTKEGYGAWFPQHFKCDNELKDLIGHMLETDTSKRFSAEQCLKHAYFTK